MELKVDLQWHHSKNHHSKHLYISQYVWKSAIHTTYSYAYVWSFVLPVALQSSPVQSFHQTPSLIQSGRCACACIPDMQTKGCSLFSRQLFRHASQRATQPPAIAWFQHGSTFLHTAPHPPVCSTVP